MASDKRTRGPIILDLKEMPIRKLWLAYLTVSYDSIRWSEDERAVLIEQLQGELTKRLGRPVGDWKRPASKREKK